MKRKHIWCSSIFTSLQQIRILLGVTLTGWSWRSSNGWAESLTEEVAKDFVDRLDKSSASPEEMERIMTIMKEIKEMGGD